MQPFPSVLISLWSPGELTSWGMLQRDVDKDSDGDDDDDDDNYDCKGMSIRILMVMMITTKMMMFVDILSLSSILEKVLHRVCACFPKSTDWVSHYQKSLTKKKPLLKMLIWVC